MSVIMRRSLGVSAFLLVGALVGAGIFALPNAFAQMGIWRASVWFWFFAALVSVTHLLYIDVIFARKEKHRLPGHVREILGRRWGVLATTTHFIQLYGVQLVYLLLGGAFLQAFMATVGYAVPVWVGMLAVFIFGAGAIRLGLKKVASADAAITIVMLALLLLVAVAAWKHGPAPTHFIPRLPWESFGLIIFALTGLPFIDGIADLCGKDRAFARRVVLRRGVLASFITWFFACALAYAGGTQIGSQPHDLLLALPEWGAFVLPLTGLMAVTTAYLSLGEELQATWIRDYRFESSRAWAVAFIPTFALALFMNDGFLVLVAILGTVCGGANGVFVGMMRTALAEQRRESFALVLGMLTVFIYAFGMSGQIISWLFL